MKRSGAVGIVSLELGHHLSATGVNAQLLYAAELAQICAPLSVNSR